MPTFFDQVVSAVTTNEAVDRLIAGRSVDRDAVKIGAVLSATAVVHELAARGPDGRSTRRRRRRGRGAEHLFGARAAQIAALIGDEAELDRGIAHELLTATSDVALERAGPGGRSLQAPPDLRSEVRELETQGWGPWFASLPVASMPAVAAAAVRQADGQDRRRRSLLVGAALVVVAVLAAIAATRIWGNDSSVIEGDDASTGTSSGTAAGPTAADPGLATAGESESSSSAAASSVSTSTSSPTSTVSDGPVSLQLAVADPQGRTDAAGTVELDLDPETGEVCYLAEATGIVDPFPGHIHVGPSGVSGGIIVDFEYIDGSERACTQSHPTDVHSILDDMAGHYVELHDLEQGFSLRTQLSDAAEVPPAGGDGDGEPSQDDQGAVIVVGDGRLTLRGEVPDAAARDALLVTAGGDDGELDVVDELDVVPGAPFPSGQVVIDDPILFPFGSTELLGDNAEAVAELAEVLRARPEWRVTLLGNTDGVGSVVTNLSLSLQRAIAVREALVADGVSPDAVVIRGNGPFASVGDNDTSEGRQQNRRIDVEFHTQSDA